MRNVQQFCADALTEAETTRYAGYCTAHRMLTSISSSQVLS
jgi:hypothetical protein